MPRCGLRLPGMLQSIAHVERGAVWLADGAERWLTDGMLGRLTCGSTCWAPGVREGRRLAAQVRGCAPLGGWQRLGGCR